MAAAPAERDVAERRHATASAALPLKHDYKSHIFGRNRTKVGNASGFQLMIRLPPRPIISMIAPRYGERETEVIDATRKGLENSSTHAVHMASKTSNSTPYKFQPRRAAWPALASDGPLL
jgi:hypothetical protein